MGDEAPPLPAKMIVHCCTCFKIANNVIRVKPTMIRAIRRIRRFGATLAKCRGIPDDLTQHMGRWVSDCFQRYFLFSDDDKTEMNKRLLS